MEKGKMRYCDSCNGNAKWESVPGLENRKQLHCQNCGRWFGAMVPVMPPVTVNALCCPHCNSGAPLGPGVLRQLGPGSNFANCSNCSALMEVLVRAGQVRVLSALPKELVGSFGQPKELVETSSLPMLVARMDSVMSLSWEAQIKEMERRIRLAFNCYKTLHTEYTNLYAPCTFGSQRKIVKELLLQVVSWAWVLAVLTKVYCNYYEEPEDTIASDVRGALLENWELATEQLISVLNAVF